MERANCERRVGLALSDGWRDKVYLQTKVGSHPDRFRDFSEEASRWSLENSFRQLKTDYVDCVIIHGPPEIGAPFEPGACLDVLLEWKGIVLVGPANRDEFDGVYESATSEVSEAVWGEFESEFELGIEDSK